LIFGFRKFGNDFERLVIKSDGGRQIAFFMGILRQIENGDRVIGARIFLGSCLVQTAENKKKPRSRERKIRAFD